jgi:hypothetical protein
MMVSVIGFEGAPAGGEGHYDGHRHWTLYTSRMVWELTFKAGYEAHVRMFCYSAYLISTIVNARSSAVCVSAWTRDSTITPIRHYFGLARMAVSTSAVKIPAASTESAKVWLASIAQCGATTTDIMR